MNIGNLKRRNNLMTEENKAEQPEVQEEQVDTSELSADDRAAFEAHIKEVEAPETESEGSETKEPVEEKSEESDETPATEDAEAEAEESNPEVSDKETKQETKGLEERFTKLETSYENLQAEFTRRSQRLKALEAENEKLRSASQTEKPTTESEQIGDDKFQSQLIEEMKKDNPKAAHLFESFGKELMTAISKKLGKDIEAIKNNLTQAEISANVDKFKKEYQEFLDSPLAQLKEELDKTLDELYPTDELLLEAVRTNPNFFKSLKESVIASNFEKAAELVTSKKKAQEQTEETKRDREIEKSKGVGKSKVSKPAVKDLMDLPEFRKLSEKEQEKLLRKKGLFQV